MEASGQFGLDLRPGEITAGQVLDRIRRESRDEAEKGRWFENLIVVKQRTLTLQSPSESLGYCADKCRDQAPNSRQRRLMAHPIRAFPRSRLG